MMLINVAQVLYHYAGHGDLAVLEPEGLTSETPLEGYVGGHHWIA